MKVRISLLLVSLLGLGLQTGCAQDALPTPRQLDSTPTPAASLPTPKPLVNEAAPLSPDPEISMANFTPGKANTYAEVHIKGPYLAMTFDDGPSSEYTPTLLDELKKRNIKATFFLVGQNVAEYPDLVKRMVAEGHEVANHSWSHPAFAKMSDAAVRNEIQKTQDAIVAACGVKPTLLRPPYGSVTQSQKKWIPAEFGTQIILWSVDPLDWKRPGESVVRSRILSGAADGAIILAHDIHGGTVKAMPETFDQLIAKGYKFATVSELLAMEQPKPSPTPRVLAKAPVTKPEGEPESTPKLHSKKAQ
ncbi:MAG: polysaccharide deacetylase family protein [Chthoniobacterales bacterium]